MNPLAKSVNDVFEILNMPIIIHTNIKLTFEFLNNTNNSKDQNLKT